MIKSSQMLVLFKREIEQYAPGRKSNVKRGADSADSPELAALLA